MKYLIAILLMCSLSTAYAQQDSRVKRSIVDMSLYLRDRWVDSVRNDTMGIIGAERSLMTAKAIFELVNTRTGIPGPQGAQGVPGIQGATGAAGADGARWFDQSGVPNPANGAIGDFSINSSNGDYYEKTGASTWTLRGNIRGPQGPQGPQGTPGTNGSNGANGATGAQGPKGEDGTSVTIKGSYPDSISLPGLGLIGDSYIVKDSLFVWDDLNSKWKNVGKIVGPAGAQGPSGTPGTKWYDQAGTPNPANGTVGDFYLNRTTGDYYEKTGVSAWTARGNIKGPTGAAGATGATGAQGIQGPQGIQGLTGAAGSKWYDGSGSPAGGTGVNGDYYLNKTNGDYYLKISGSWSVQGNLRGPAGEDGAGGGYGGSGAVFIDNF